MVSRPITVYLLAFPIGLMGTVQMGFAVLSHWIFHDREETEFFMPALVMLVVAVLSAMMQMPLLLRVIISSTSCPTS